MSLVLSNFKVGPWGVSQQSFIRGGSTPKSSPLAFYIPFLTEKVPFRIPSIEKWYLFHIATEKHCIPFLNPWNAVNEQKQYYHVLEIS